MPDNNKVLTTAQVAEGFGVSRRTVTRWADNEDLRSRKIPGSRNGIYLFEVADVEAFGAALDELAAAPPADTLPLADVELPAGCDAR